jgi:hypothetical protein
MKILISNENDFAHKFEREGLMRAFQYAGMQCAIWDMRGKCSFDAMNEFEPDILITQSYNIDRGLEKCIAARPAMRVICKAGDWWTNPPNTAKYPVLHASKKEKDTVLRLRDECGKPDFLFIHYHLDYLEMTHGEWTKRGVPVKSSMNAADLFLFTKGQWREEFSGDIAFVGGYWPYKSLTLDKYIKPLCNPELGLKIRVFGNQQWNAPQYCGFCPDHEVKNILKSAAICPNVSELHSEDFGHDVIERPFKLASNKCFIISDYVEGLEKIYGDSIVYAKTTQDFIEKVYHYLKNPQEKMAKIAKAYEITLREHTYFDRAASILDNLNMKYEANNLRIAKMKFIQENGL